METQVKHEVEESIDTSSTTPNTSQTELEINEETGLKTPVMTLNINKEQKQKKCNEADEDNNASQETVLKTIANAATAITINRPGLNKVRQGR